MLDPTEGCRIKGCPADWQSLPRDKSLFYSPKGCGLPIGNLTSQLFSNVCLGRLDDYMKRTLKCRHYGRYVDDFYVVSTSRERFRSRCASFRGVLSHYRTGWLFAVYGHIVKLQMSVGQTDG